MSTETTNKKIKIDNGTTFGRTYTDKAIDAKLPTDLIATANKLSLGVGNAPLGNGVNLSGFTYDEATKTLKASGGGGGLTFPTTSPTSQLIPSITTSNEQQNLTIGNGLEIKNGALQEKVLTISITDILTDNGKIQELFSKMTSTTEQSALISFDNQINYNTYKDYDTIKLDLSPLSSMGVSGYYILRNQSHLNGYTPVYSLITLGFSTSGNNLNKLVIKHLIIAGDDKVNTPLNKFLLKIL